MDTSFFSTLCVYIYLVLCVHHSAVISAPLRLQVSCSQFLHQHPTGWYCDLKERREMLTRLTSVCRSVSGLLTTLGSGLFSSRGMRLLMRMYTAEEHNRDIRWKQSAKALKMLFIIKLVGKTSSPEAILSWFCCLFAHYPESCLQSFSPNPHHSPPS